MSLRGPKGRGNLPVRFTSLHSSNEHPTGRLPRRPKGLLAMTVVIDTLHSFISIASGKGLFLPFTIAQTNEKCTNNFRNFRIFVRQHILSVKTVIKLTKRYLETCYG